ncbi:hypothetical protein ACJZ2D_012158 [Fusarium nematophilum]
MEVLGAVASSIAIVQGLTMANQVVSLIREVPEIQGDFDDLKKELGLISSMVKVAQQRIQSSTSDSPEQDLITRAADQLSGVISELNALLQSCVKETNEGDKKLLRAKRRKWLLEGGRIKKLEQKMQNAKSTLHFAVMSNNMSCETQFQAEIRLAMNFCMNKLVEQADAGRSRVEELPDVPPASDNLQEELGQSDLAITTTRRRDLTSAPEPESSRRRTRRQPKDFVRLRSSMKTRRKDSNWIRLEYQVPKWFFASVLCFKASYSNLTGVNCSLRPAGIIETTAGIWFNLEKPFEIARRTIMKNPYHPNDHDPDGEGLMEYAVRQELYPALSILLDLWANILRETGLPRAVLYTANRVLQNGHQTDYVSHLLHRVISFVKDQPESTNTEVHMAIHRGQGLQEALRKEPWAVNMLDGTGLAPLHLAVLSNRTEDAEQLIAAQADINLQNSDGWTPLMVAARFESLDCARVLLKAKCDINAAGSSDQVTALHLAAESDSPELVRLLLAAGASATARNHWGYNPLHRLARYSTASPETVRDIIETLTLANADIDAHNDIGSTPLLVALMWDRLTNARCLVDAGCSLFAINNVSSNLLHLAALYGSFEMLEFLAGLDLSGVNPYQIDVNGDTPWDLFIYGIRAPEWDLDDRRRPSTAEEGAFAQLYQGIRDRNLQHDIDHLEWVVSAILEQDITTARENLAPLMEKEEEWKRDSVVAWLRAVDKRIQHKEWALAEDDVRGCLEELRAELATSVWDIPSKNYTRWDSSDEEDYSTSGGEESECEESENEESEDEGSDGEGPEDAGSEDEASSADNEDSQDGQDGLLLRDQTIRG